MQINNHSSYSNQHSIVIVAVMARQILSWALVYTGNKINYVNEILIKVDKIIWKFESWRC